MTTQLEDINQELPPARRHIIRRPRLTKLLDEAEARVLLLVAPAGYGKTTLAREWLAAKGRTGLWFRIRTGSTDLVSVALGIARSIDSIAPDAERLVTEFIASRKDPDSGSDEIADLLAQEVHRWPSGTWLVIDDYQDVSGVESSNSLLARFVEQAPVRVLITSRHRPSWVSPRKLLYGDAFEVPRSALAMTEDEVTRVLRNAPPEAPTLMRLAQGWPAVIGLAALLPRMDAATRRLVPEELYDFLAQELYGHLGERSREDLPWLAVPESLDARLVAQMLGADAAASVVVDGARVGFITSDSDELEIHPLARDFLRRKLRGRQRDEPRERHAIACMLATSRWDDAFQAIQFFATPDLLPELIRGAFDAMLNEGRLSALADWVEWYRKVGSVEAPEIALIRAELALRHGDWRLAETLAASCAETTPYAAVAARALLCAGTAVNLLDEAAPATAYFERAVEVDDSPLVQRAALWGEFIAASFRGGDAWRVALRRLEELKESSPAHLIRVQQARMMGAVRGGSLAEAASAGLATEPLLADVTDPIVRSGFLNSLADTLVMAGMYGHAEKAAMRELEEAERFRLHFVVPNALANLALARLGQARYTAALAALDRASLTDTTDDPFVRTNRLGARARVLLSMRDFVGALQLAHGLDNEAREDIVSEVAAILAFGYSLSERRDEAIRYLDRARLVPWFTATRVFIAAVEAVLPSASTPPDADAIAHFDAVVLATEHIDCAVCVLRACPALIQLGLTPEHDRVMELAARACRDPDLSVAVGLPPRGIADGVVSRRELEVLELVAQGFRNSDIAARLVISERTVKTHLQNIFEKLGVRSRTEAAARARDRGLLD